MLRTLPKNQLGPNHWAFVTGGAVASLPEPAVARECQEACQRALEGLEQQLARVPPRCWALLEKKLVMLEGASGGIPQEELATILRQAGLQVEPGDAEALAAGLPAARPRRVDSRALLRWLRGRLQY
jgi:hypothetical protein